MSNLIDIAPAWIDAPVIRGGGRPDTYKLANGKRAVSVTTITGRMDSKESLIHWAWKEGSEGRDYRESRDSAASVGTAVHDAIEEFAVAGSVAEPDFAQLADPDHRHQATLAYRAFAEWHGRECPAIRIAEFPIVNERLGVAGTIDALGWIGGKWTLIDWKTSNGIYNGHVVQVGGYVTLWNEARPEMPIEQCAILRFGKDGTRHEHVFSAAEMEPARELFEIWLSAYRMDAVIAKILKPNKRQTKEPNHVQES